MSGVLAAIKLGAKQLFAPETPGPVRNEIQRLFAETIATLLRNRDLMDDIGRTAGQRSKRGRATEERLTIEAEIELRRARMKLERVIERAAQEQVDRERRALERAQRQAVDLASAGTPAERARVAEKQAQERAGYVNMAAELFELRLQQLSFQRGVQIRVKQTAPQDARSGNAADAAPSPARMDETPKNQPLMTPGTAQASPSDGLTPAAEEIQDVEEADDVDNNGYPNEDSDGE